MRPERTPRRRRVPGTILLVLGLLPGWAWAGTAAGAEREPHAARYTIREASLEPEGDPSSSGRFRLNGELDTLSAPAKPVWGTRFVATAKLALDADCSDVILADSFE